MVYLCARSLWSMNGGLLLIALFVKLASAGHLLFGGCADIFIFLRFHWAYLLLCRNRILANMLEIRRELPALLRLFAVNDDLLFLEFETFFHRVDPVVGRHHFGEVFI
jgi:hypothetical protein